jgi:hypothetical protein
MLNVTLLVNAMSTTLIFIKSNDRSLLYNCNKISILK